MALTPQELPAYWQEIIRRTEDEGPKAAANAMARVFHNQVVGVELVRFSHSAGTRTPAPAGGPPAAVTGGLRRSVRLHPARSTGGYRAQSSVAPTIKYARNQELGGTVTAKHTYTDKRGVERPGYLRWGPKGAYRFAHSVTLPARPYMRPVHRRTIEDGSLRNAAAAAVRKVVLG
jgi:hypothetical protein